MKRVVTIQDISCVGKCSLTVALPIISAMGLECAVVPTAVLSTHTAFSGFTFHDLTKEIDLVSRHWLQLGLRFDAIYTGFLGSFEQLEIVSRFIDDHRRDGTIVFVDPAMGDFGKLYAGFTPEFARAMGTMVCAKADIIDPNMTEAAFLLDIPYVESGYDEEFVKGVLRRLCGLGAKKAILKGVRLEPGRCGVMSFDSTTGQFFRYFTEFVEGSFHGTGDIFSSAAVGALMNGKSLEDSLAIAADFTVASIKATIAQPQHNWYGVNFETEIGLLLKKLG